MQSPQRSPHIQQGYPQLASSGLAKYTHLWHSHRYTSLQSPPTPRLHTCIMIAVVQAGNACKFCRPQCLLLSCADTLLDDTLVAQAKASNYISSRPKQSSNTVVQGVQKVCTVQQHGAPETANVESGYASSVSNCRSCNLHKRVDT